MFQCSKAYHGVPCRPLTTHDMILGFLRGRHGLENQLVQPMKRQSDSKVMPKSRLTFYVVYEESTLQAKRSKIRGPLDQARADAVAFVHHDVKSSNMSVFRG